MSDLNVGKTNLKGRWQRSIDGWMSRRAPKASQVQLSNKNIYILPSRQGWLLCSVLIVMLLTAINYQNSLLFGLCFWIGSVFAMVIWHTWKNLAQLQLETASRASGFAGDVVQVPFKIRAQKQTHQRLEISWRSSGQTSSEQANAPVIVSLSPESSESISLPFSNNQRGFVASPRLVVASVYPMGILRAWSVIDLDQPVLLYPKPVFGVSPNDQVLLDGSDDADKEEPKAPELGGSDFYEISPYRRGDALNRIDWKRLAKTGEKVTKTFGNQTISVDRELNFELFRHLPLEHAISAMTGWVVEWSQAGLPFKFQLGDVEIECFGGEGSLEVARCLEALALFGKSSSSVETAQ